MNGGWGVRRGRGWADKSVSERKRESTASRQSVCVCRANRRKINFAFFLVCVSVLVRVRCQDLRSSAVATPAFWLVTTMHTDSAELPNLDINWQKF